MVDLAAIQNLLAAQRLDDAEAACRRALASRPGDAPLLHLCAGVAHFCGDPTTAIERLQGAVRHSPGQAALRNDLGNLYRLAGRIDEALAELRQACALAPATSAHHANLAIVAKDAGDLRLALAEGREAVRLEPANPTFRMTLANILRDLGELDAAIAAYRQAASGPHDAVNLNWNLSLALLAAGHLAEGWRHYEYRWQLPALAAAAARYRNRPRWTGDDPAGKTLLVWPEQGLGDYIQFCRYLPALAAYGVRVIAETPRPLLELASSLPGIELLPAGEPLPEHDCHVPLLSLPLYFGTSLEHIPAPIPYLSPPPDREAAWKEKLAQDTSFKVGLCWAGAPRPDQPDAHLVDRRRSLQLSSLAPLASIPGIRFYSLQKGPGATQAIHPPFPMLDFTGRLDNFADTAALVANLDLVISVDTSVAHLSAALGRPTWLLSRYDACWRWLRNREDSPWYPSLKLFRQKEPGRWDEVITAVGHRLRDISFT